LACKNWSALILSNHWCVFILKVAWSGWDTGGLHATFGLKIAPVVAENKSRPIWGWSIQPKRTVSGRISCTDHLPSLLASLVFLDSAACNDRCARVPLCMIIPPQTCCFCLTQSPSSWTCSVFYKLGIGWLKSTYIDIGQSMEVWRWK
jgi:hypothetical protein